MEKLTHWKKLENPDYLGAYAFGQGEDMIVTVRGFERRMVTGADAHREEKTVLLFDENVKPLVLNVTNAKRISKMFRTSYIEQWIGRRIQLYVDPNVKAFGEICEGVRVRPDPPREEALICFDCKRPIEAYGRTSPRALALHTQKNYGRMLCAECAERAKREAEENGGQ